MNRTGLEPKRARVAQLQGVAGGECMLNMGRGEQLEFIQCRGQAVDARLAGLVLGNGLHVEFVISQNDERDATDGRLDHDQFYQALSNLFVVEVGKQLLKRLDQFNSRERKSTRLNSSHVAISYAVFCLKKKK